MNSHTRLNAVRPNSAMPGIGYAKATTANASRVSILSILIVTFIGSCVPVPRGPNPLELQFMSTEGLREYAEEVFRDQNRLTTRLMMAPMHADSISRKDRRRVDRAESRMNDACASLNEIASARAQGKEVDLELENRVREDVRGCAQQTKRLQALLDELGIGTSR